MDEKNIKIIDVLRTSGRFGAEGDPVRAYRLPGFDAHTFSKPAHKDSGDLYALSYLREDKTALFIGDIAGHDFSSTIVAAEALKYIEKNRTGLADPGGFLTRLGVDMLKKFQSLHRFMTAAVFVFDRSRDTMRFSSAGNPAPLIYSGAEGRTSILRLTGFPIGFDETVYSTGELGFHEKDMIVAVTDGVVTAKNDGDEEFGYERLERCVAEAAGDPARSLKAIAEEIAAFGTTRATLDDRTVVCVKRV